MISGLAFSEIRRLQRQFGSNSLQDDNRRGKAVLALLARFNYQRVIKPGQQGEHRLAPAVVVLQAIRAKLPLQTPDFTKSKTTYHVLPGRILFIKPLRWEKYL